MRHLLIAFVGLIVFSLFLSCQKEISVEFGSPAKGSLQSSGGDCLPKLVAGSYTSGKALNDSNFIEVTVNVTAPGPYTIYTDTLFGYSFRTTGSFTNTGSQVVRLKGSGTPSASGVHLFTVVAFDSSFCDVEVTVLPAGTTPGPAVFTLAGTPNGCANFNLNGTYYKDSTLDQRHSVVLNVNVTSVGSYTISAQPVNGYSFSKTGSFGATGLNQLVLDAAGKPLATGTNTFTVTAGSSTCTFNVTVTTPTTNPPPTGCNPNVQGTYTVGTATTASNTVTVTHTYATAGTYNVTVPTVNGITFATQSVVATIPGPNTITLTASGNPTAAGTSNFTVNFGDGQNCTFPVTVNPSTPPPVNNDYFPLTANSWWSYDAGGGDTIKITNTGSTTVTGSSNTYQRFVTTFQNSPVDTSFYRRDAANDLYYQSLDTAGWGTVGLRFNQARLDVKFLKNNLATGDSIVSDFNAIASTPNGPLPVVLRFKYKVVNANATLTVGSRTFTNVYHLQDYIEFGAGGTFVDSGEAPWDYYYVRGVGLVRFKAGSYDQLIRFWLVN